MIVMGLYSVLWGKSKDETPSTPGISEAELSVDLHHQQQMAKMSSGVGSLNEDSIDV